LDGIEKRMDPGDPFNGNLYMFHSIENEFDKLPSTLNEAIEALESDEVLVKALGETFMETFIKRKKAEWKEYHDYVSEWEVEKYLKGY